MTALIIKRKIPWLPANRYETARKRNLELDLRSQRVLKFHLSEITRVSFDVLLLLTPDKNVKMTSDVILSFLSDVRISNTAIMHSLCRICFFYIFWSYEPRRQKTYHRVLRTDKAHTSLLTYRAKLQRSYVADVDIIQLYTERMPKGADGIRFSPGAAHIKDV